MKTAAKVRRMRATSQDATRTADARRAAQVRRLERRRKTQTMTNR